MSMFTKARVILAPLISESGRQALGRVFKRSFTGVHAKYVTYVGAGSCTAAGMGIPIGMSIPGKEDKSNYINELLSRCKPAVDTIQSAVGLQSVSATACGKGKSQNCHNTQCCIVDPTRYMYSLYVWINIDHSANPRLVAKVAADMETLVDSVSSECEDPCNPCEDVLVGVGFGPNFYTQVMGKTCKNYYYTPRKGYNGEMPYTPGDIILYAKCNQKGKLFDLTKNYITSFPEGSIQDFEDIYGFDFRNNCDLSGMRLVTNRPDECGRRAVAVECETGGSYSLAQKWIHDFCVIRPENRTALEKYVGRDMDCAAELKNKLSSSHVARMRGSTDLMASPHCECVMTGNNYGTLSGDAGMFVLAFASDPAVFEFMLDRMVGAGCDTVCDDIMRMSKCVKGTYFYFPAVHELCHLTKSAPV